MGLENATYIADLVATNPDGADAKLEGDNHIRLIKATLQATLPGLNREFNLTRAAEWSDLTFTKTGAYTLVAGDHGKVLLLNATGGGFTITLPDPASAAPVGWTIVLLRVDDTVNQVQIARRGAATIASGAATSFYLQGHDTVVVLRSDGTNWRPINLYPIDELTLTSVSDVAGSGPAYRLIRLSASPAAEDGLGRVDFYGQDSAGNLTKFADVRGVIVDPTNTSEDGKLQFLTIRAGSLLRSLTVERGIYSRFTGEADPGDGKANFLQYQECGVPLLRGYIDGLELSIGSDANHEIDVAPGVCRDEANGKFLQLASTLTVDIETTGALGLDTGSSLTANTWYHVYVIGAADNSNAPTVIASQDLTPVYPSGYNIKRRIGSVLTNGSANLVGFFQHGDHFFWHLPVVDSSSVPSTGGSTLTLTVPPHVVVLADVNGSWHGSSNGTRYVYISSLDAAAQTAHADVHTAVVSSGIEGGQSWYDGNFALLVKTNTSRQIRGRSSSVNGTFRLFTRGWIDKRGRNS